MKNKRPYFGILVLAGALATGACSKNAESPAPADEALLPAAGEPRPARVLPLPGEPAAPSGGAMSQLAWDAPTDWIAEPPASNMRRAQFRVPGPEGDGLCIVYYFGPGQGGDPLSNAKRWAGQFRQPDGRPSVELMQISKLEGTRVPVQVVEVTGVYDGGMSMTDAPAEQQAGYMLLGAIAEGGDAPWFFKFTGPEATVRAQRDAFVQMMESLRLAS